MNQHTSKRVSPSAERNRNLIFKYIKEFKSNLTTRKTAHTDHLYLCCIYQFEDDEINEVTSNATG